jgi:glucan phosphoethanolaminetransferase (alkaline phosphatase superfamily)
VFVVLVLLVNLPNMLPWEQTQYPTVYIFDLQDRLLKCLLLAALYFSFFQRPWRAWLILWLLCLWWMPISLAVRFINFTPITSSLLGILLESTPRELMEFFLTLPWTFYLLFAALNGLFFAVYRWLKNRPHLIWRMKPRLALAVPGFALIVLFSGTTPAQHKPVVTKSSPAPVVSDLFSSEHAPSIQEADLPFAFPYELGWAYEQYAQAQRTVQGAIAQMRGHRQSLHIRTGVSGPDVVVLVIGESSSRQDWQLFNSATVDTTPRLKSRLLQDPGLLPFTNVVAQSTATRYAVPGMLTNAPLYWPDGQPNPGATPSIIQMAQQAGYSTAWLSNQTSGGKFDGPIAIYAKEAQTVAFLNPSSFAYPGTYDEVLLPLLRRQLQAHTKAFVVLHTMGSHFQFAHRYPPEFERFKPALQKSLLNEANAQNQQEVINAYRNSVLYTDHILEEVIRTLETSGRSTAMVYASDHGQGLTESGCSQPAINRTMARAYEVPALVWLSKEYRGQHPAVPAHLASHANLPYTTHAVYQTLVDLMEGKTQDQENTHSATTDPSFFAPPPSKSAQMVVSSDMRWLDFLVAAQRNRCLISAR